MENAGHDEVVPPTSATGGHTSRRNQFSDHTSVGFDGNPFASFDPAEVAAQIGTQVAETDVHRPSMATCGCIAKGVYNGPMEFKRITTNPRQLGGVPCLRGLRIPVATIVALVAEGEATDAILALYPDLEADDVREALLFAAEAVRERTLPLAAGE